MVSYDDLSTLKIETKNVTYTIGAKPPHNFYYISSSKGPVPKALKGSFTSITLAEQEVKRYINSTDKKQTE